MKRGERAVLVSVVVAVALLLRWAFVAQANVVEPLRADAGQYAQAAQNLVEHGVYGCERGSPPRPDSFRSPGYPFLIAGCRLLGGADWHPWLLAVQVALGTLLVPLTYRLARRWLSFWLSLGAAVLAAVSPHLVVGCTYVLTETLSATLLLLAFVCFASATAGRASATWVAGGVAGAAILTNEALLPLAVLALAMLWRRAGWRRAVMFAAACGVLLLPWQIRNRTTELARTGGERVVASASHGSYPGMVFGPPQSFGFPYRFDPEQPKFGQSWAGFWPVFTQRFGERPWRHLGWYLLEKPVWLWSWPILQGSDVYVYEVRNSLYERQPVAAASLWLSRWLHWPMVALAMVGALAAWRQRRLQPVAWAIAATLLSMTAVYAAFLPDPRYLVPLRPLVGITAMGGVAALLRVWSARRGGAIVAASGAHSSVG